MRDRQYLLSLATTVIISACIAAGLLCGLWLSGWQGIIGVLLITSGMIGWFYWGPRPDLKPGGALPNRDPGANG
jgi:hypothetical protein